MQPDQRRNASDLVIDGVQYFSAAEVARVAGVTRQTLWKWRHDGKVPLGRKYRDKQVLFTATESAQIREYAHRLEPIETGVPEHSVKCASLARREAINDEQRE